MAKPTRRRNPARLLISLLFSITALIALWVCLGNRDMSTDSDPSPAEIETAAPNQANSHTNAGHYRRKADFYTILVCGTDEGNGGSDTNILLAVDAENNSVYGVSIPRDTKAVFNGKSHKINAAYNSGGIKLVSSIVSEQLGIPVDHTIHIDLTGFISLIDAMGGVDFDVPIDMDYDDPLQDLSIHLKAGMQHLDGRQAMGVVRFRHNNDGTGYGNEDIGRMQTQQAFLKEVFRQCASLSGLARIGDFSRIFHESVETDLTLQNLAWLGVQGISAGTDGLEFSTLPGAWKSPYIYLDAEETLTLVNEHLNPYTEDRNAEDLNIPS